MDRTEIGEGGLAKAIHQVQDAVGAMVGMASASTMGAHDSGAFTRSASISSLYEIEAGRLALERSESTDVKRFAELIVRDHLRMSASMAKKAPADASANELDNRRQGMLDHLRAASGADFDKLFLQQQLAAHKEAVTLHQGFIKGAAEGVLLGLASASLPVLKQHLDIVTALEQGTSFDRASATVGDSRLTASGSALPSEKADQYGGQAPGLESISTRPEPQTATQTSSIAGEPILSAGGGTYAEADYSPAARRSESHLDQLAPEPPTTR